MGKQKGGGADKLHGGLRSESKPSDVETWREQTGRADCT